MLLNNIPKQPISNRLTHRIVSHFLDALVEDKISFEHVAGPDLSKKLHESLLAQGLSINIKDETYEIDKEFINLFDDKTKEYINDLVKSKLKKTNKTIKLTIIKP